MTRTALTAALLGVLAATCNPVFAPPLRSLDYGAPGRLAAGEGEVGTGVTLFVTHGLLAAFPVGDEASVEAAFDWVPLALGDRRDAWAMGSLGGRWRVVSLPDREAGGWAVDLEAGAGAGVGGADRSDRSWWDIPAGGVYFGVGGGYHLGAHVALYSRGRFQAVGARGIPTTVWWSGKLGSEFTIGPIFITLGLGGAGYANADDVQPGVLAELLIGGKFPL